MNPHCTRPLKMLTVANMYPSATDPTYGTFIKNFVTRINELNVGGSNRVVTIYGRRQGKLSKLLAYLSYYCRLTGALLARRYDLIYVHTITFPTPALRIASLFRRLPIVFNVHGDDVLPSNGFKRMLKRMSRPLLPKAKTIVSPSAYFKEVLLQEFPELNPDRIFVSPSGGIDSKFFVPHARQTASTLPGELPLERPVEIGFVSRIDTGKGWDTLLRAISALKAQGLKVHATFAGRGSQSSMLENMINELGLTREVNYVGPVAHDKLPALYASFDLFVFPTTRLNESLGLVGLEAMAAGTPVIASNMAGPAGYVTHGVNGYLFTPGSVEALTQALTTFIALPLATRHAFSVAAVQAARAYEADSVARTLYNHLLTLHQ